MSVYTRLFVCLMCLGKMQTCDRFGFIFMKNKNKLEKMCSHIDIQTHAGSPSLYLITMQCRHQRGSQRGHGPWGNVGPQLHYETSKSKKAFSFWGSAPRPRYMLALPHSPYLVPP